MHILSIKINNILSISDIELNFENSGLVLLEGWNYDDNRANGAGKTAVFNALTFGLYGDLPRKVTSTEIVKKGSKSGFVEVTLSVGNDVLKVRRERPKKETFEKNGIKLDITQKEFESYIKLSYEQFLISMYSAQTSGSKFLSLNDSSKKDFLLQLMNLTKFNECKELVKIKIKELEIKIQEFTNKLESNNSKLDIYKENLVEEEIVLKDIKLNLDLIDGWTKDIVVAQQVQKPNMSKFISLEHNLTSEMESVFSAKVERSILWKQYQLLQSQDVPFVRGGADVVCPFCDGELKLNDSTVTKVDDIKALKEQHQSHSDNIKTKLATMKLALDLLDTTISREKELRDILNKLKSKKDREYESYHNATNAISNLNSSIVLKKVNNSSLQDKLDNNAEINVKVVKLKEASVSIALSIKILKEELELNDSVLFMFSATGAPAYILDSVIESFNEAVSTHMDLVWSNASYKLKSYKENSTGDISAKFSEEFIVSGKEHSIGSLSGGEFRSLSLIVDFAIIDVLCKQFGMSLNPIIMDEPFEGLDAVSRERVIELLERLAVDRQIIIVDHVSEAKAMFSKVIKIEKRGGSSIVAIDP